MRKWGMEGVCERVYWGWVGGERRMCEMVSNNVWRELS